MKNNIKVAVGIVVNSHQDVLIAKRPSHVDQGGKWEFPGGKVEANETIEQALARELKEEIDLDTLVAEPFIEISHDYEKYSVLLSVWLVKKYQGKARGSEGQEIRWVKLEELSQYPFPAANTEIVDKLIEHYDVII